jgi:hypothetical protein
MIIILQWQSELKSQEARILGLQNGLQRERIVQLEAAITSKDEEMKKKDDEMKKKDEQLSELVDLQTKGEVTINEMQALQTKDEVIILDLEVKLTILEAELAEGQECIESYQEDLAKHKVILMNLSRDIFNSLRTNEI